MFAFIENWKRRRLAYLASLEHARMHGLDEEFKAAYRYYGDSIAALEEWDLLDNHIINKLNEIYK